MSSYLKRMRLERWHLRRKSINISCLDEAIVPETHVTKTNSTLNNSSSNKHSKQNDEPAEMPTKTAKPALQTSSEKAASNSKSKLTSQQQQAHFQLYFQLKAAPLPLSLAPIPLLLLLSISLSLTIILLALTAEQVKAAPPDLIAKRESTAAGLMRGLIQQLVSLEYPDHWTSLPSLQSQIGVRDPANSSRPGASAGRPATRLLLRRALARLRNRIGARNSIRVHNAFRDLAWRLLSSFSMPTPIIYEIRRQHLYSLEDDTLNDSLYNKNTTKTIRSKRHLDVHRALRQKLPRLDQEHDSFTSRARAKFEDLLNPEHRRQSLFGRMVRFPGALFSFKRQQQDEKLGSDDQDSNEATSPSATAATATADDDDITDTEIDDKRSSKLTSTNSNTLLGPIAKLLQRRRRKKDPDRQMISIDGKQYYVNEEGQLKELPENEQ